MERMRWGEALVVVLKELAIGAIAVREDRGREERRRKRSAERQEGQIMASVGDSSASLVVRARFAKFDARGMKQLRIIQRDGGGR